MGWLPSCSSFPLKICQFTFFFWRGAAKQNLKCGCAAKYRLHVRHECRPGKVGKKAPTGSQKPLGAILSALRSGIHRFILAASRKKKKKKHQQNVPNAELPCLTFSFTPTAFIRGHRTSNQMLVWEPGGISLRSFNSSGCHHPLAALYIFIFSAPFLFFLPRMGFSPRCCCATATGIQG